MSTLVLALVLAAVRADAVVIRSVENMYAKASADAEVASQAILGQTVAVLERKPGFARIETPDSYHGWIALGALREYGGPRAPRYAARGEVLEIVTLMASVYREASATTARPRIRAPLGARLESAGPAVSERWLRVRLPSGEPGFIQSGDVRRVDAGAAPPRGSGDDVVATARRLLGVPYQWGGMTPAGIDCSGLASLAYGVNGLVLLRDADIQITDPRFVEVDRSGLRAGDLVFFGKTKDAITHVGLYEADGRFISATTHLVPVVQESSLDEPHWAQLYQGARRPR